ncbi:hypothetical protein GCM10028895_21180 [Pontibacter rugosus]
MVTGDIVYFGTFGNKAHQVLYHLHVCGRPIAFTKLPDIYNISIQDYCFRVDAFKIGQQLLCMTAIGAEVYVRNNNYLYFSFFAISVAWVRIN